MNTNPTPDALAVLIAELRACDARDTPGFASELIMAAADSLEAFHAKPDSGTRDAVSIVYRHYERAMRQASAEPSALSPSRKEAVAISVALQLVLAELRAALQSPPPVVSGEFVTDLEIAAEEYVSEYVMSTEGNDYVPTEWERELISDALAGWLAEQPAQAPPVVEEGRREAETIAQVIEEARAKYREPTDWDYGALDACTRIERAILALTPVEGVGEKRAYSPGEVVAEAEAIWNDALWHFNPDWKEADGFEGSRDRAIKSISTALIMHDNYCALSTPATAQGDVREAIRTAHAIFEQATDFYTARNGRRMSIEGDDGEKCWIVPFDAFEDLRHALATLKGQDNE